MSDFDYTDMYGETYEALYARYLKNPSRLLEASAKVLDEHTKLLDLCSGSGVVIREAVRRGVAPENITAVDVSKSMASTFPPGVDKSFVSTMLWCALVQDLPGDCGEALAARGPFDLITCRQAINYWWNVLPVEKVVRLLARDGRFAFNTFNTPPPEYPTVKQYTYEGHEFTEVVQRVENVVYHVQARRGLPLHLTTFRWISPGQFAEVLFDLQLKKAIVGWERVIDGPTDTYVCRAAP
jgi:ubiquinone/menaquinone biosynthesis C-methylase UbiE